MKKNERLFSLDILRGLDMLLLTVGYPLFAAINRLAPLPESVQRQFHHYWGGFTLWDIIMPLFIFLCGAAVPYALSKRLDDEGHPTPAFWKHVFSRIVLLWFCGMLVQGNLATLDILKISPYNNTLETIAAGYLVAALVMLVPSRAFRFAAPFVLAAVYGGLLHFLGDYSKTGNFAAVIEAKILGAILPADNQFMKAIANPEVGVPYSGYTWFLTTPMFGFMALCGAQCAEILRGAWDRKRKAVALLLFGAVLLALGWGLVFAGVPMIKHIFTVSFTFQAMGWSVLALGLLYVLADIFMFRRGWWLVTLFGQCALTAYMVTHFFRGALQKAAEAVVQGVPHLLGRDIAGLAPERAQHLDAIQSLVLAVTTAALLTFVLWVRRRLRAASPATPAESTETTPPPPAPPTHDSGAIAARFRQPDDAAPASADATPAADENIGPKMASKVRLKIH